jgi:transcriptional regulator with XRE-family HTH domain
MVSMASSNVTGDLGYFNADESVFIAARRLSHLRESSKMSEEQLAEVVGVDPARVKRWERAEEPLHAEHVRRLAEYFAVQPAYLRGEE